jgi:hypothetical protein
MQDNLTTFFEVPEDSDFPPENIPFGVVSANSNPNVRFPATRIGNNCLNQEIGLSTLGNLKISATLRERKCHLLHPKCSKAHF